MQPLNLRRLGLVLRTPALCVLAACATPDRPKLSMQPMAALPVANDEGELSYAELAAPLLRVTSTARRYLMPRPGLAPMVDAQIEAMRTYVRRHHPSMDEGELERVDRAKATGAVEGADGQAEALEAEFDRLDRAVIELSTHLPMSESATPMLREGVRSLVQTLGTDAIYLEGLPATQQPGAELATEMRDGIGYITIPHLLDDIGDRIIAVLGQWIDSERPPRALVIDLSTCEFGNPRPAAVVINALAPGRLGFFLRVREDGGDEEHLYRFQGALAAGLIAYRNVPLFVVTSRRTSGVAEAVVHAMRTHRQARIFGQPSHGSGGVLHWITLPWDDSVGLAIGELSGADGEPLRARALIPDACGVDGVLVVGDSPDQPPPCAAQADPPERHLLWQYVGEQTQPTETAPDGQSEERRLHPQVDAQRG